MSALGAAALLLQVLLVALPLSLRQAGGRQRRSSQNVVQRAIQAAGERHPSRVWGVRPGALALVVLGTEGQNGLQPLPLLWKDANTVGPTGFTEGERGKPPQIKASAGITQYAAVLKPTLSPQLELFLDSSSHIEPVFLCHI